MGEGSTCGSLTDWIGQNYDIYAIGVQECIDIQTFEDELSPIIGSNYHLIREYIGNV